MILKENELIDGHRYDVLDKGGDLWPEVRCIAAFRVFLVEYGDKEKRIPIEDVYAITVPEVKPW